MTDFACGHPLTRGIFLASASGAIRDPPTTPADTGHGPLSHLPTDRRALLAGIGGIAAGEAEFAGGTSPGSTNPNANYTH